nr:hypothetical protein [Salinispora cortesiana]
MAERSGVPKSALARIESQPGAGPRVRTVERRFRAVGVELVARLPGAEPAERARSRAATASDFVGPTSFDRSSVGEGQGGLGEGSESLAEAPGVAVARPDRVGDGAELDEG